MPRLAALLRHPLALAGAVLASVSGTGFVVLAVAVVAGWFVNPYAGLAVGIVLPAALVTGLLLIPLGLWVARRRARSQHREPDEDWPVIDFHRPHVRRVAALIAVLTAANVAIVLLGAHASLRWMESPSFCGQVCHTPMRPQFTAWQGAAHAGTACVRCHIGEGAPAFVHAKLAGVRQLAHVTTNSYARPIGPGAGMPAGAQALTCRSCHTPSQTDRDRIRVIREYADDEGNSETVTTLRMRIGAIHWHADPDNHVEYVATGAGNGNIPYVRVLRRGRAVQEYRTAEATDRMIREGTRRVMDCVDCHNTVGHPIAQSADRAVDDAMAVGLVSRQLPHARREAVRILNTSYAGDGEAMDAIAREFRGFYRSRGGAIDEEAVSRAVAALQALYRRNVFPEMKVTWGSYPDNRGHLTSTGCFRCHDGSHANDDGAAISSDCESCHIQLDAPG